MRVMWFVSYVVSVAFANVITAATHPLHVLGLFVPLGTFFIGLTLLLRNMVQIRRGKLAVYVAIGVGLVVSALSSHFLGDTVAITVASAASFLISESSDTEVFSRLMRKTIYTRVLSGGSVGGILDSVIFVVLGLSPVGAGFLPWDQVPNAIIGQLIVKLGMQALGASAVARLARRVYMLS